MTREILQHALNALLIGFECAVEVQHSTECSLRGKMPLLCKKLADDVKQIEDAMAAIRAELAKTEPVAMMPAWKQWAVTNPPPQTPNDSGP